MKSHSEFTFKLPALRILENEHQYLNHLMEQWHTIVIAFENDVYTLEEGHEALQTLRKMIKDFIDPLKNHTEKEEKYLFKKLELYVGAEQGPVKAVEEEHLEIDAYIGHFLYHTRGNIGELSMDDMKALVRDAGEAFEVITFHFVKEESVIFPMVEDVLREEEQKELFDHMYSPII